jgi:hypothetical protein
MLFAVIGLVVTDIFWFSLDKMRSSSFSIPYIVNNSVVHCYNLVLMIILCKK